MATRICPDCGAQYVATVRRCIDCDAVLVDQVAPEVEGEAASSAAPVGDGDQVGYELEGWGNQLKVTLEGMLDRAGIPRAWEAGALVVAAHDEQAVDDLIATLEGDELPDLDDDAPRVALEIEGLDADDHDDLDARLIAEAVPHAWDDDGALIVAETDEDRVLAIIDETLDRSGDDDGLEAHEALSALYVAVDKLAKGPHDRKPATAYVRAAAALDGLAVPYGFGPDDWEALGTEVATLAALVAPHADPPAPTDDDVDETDDDADVVDDEAAVDEAAETDGLDDVTDEAADTVAGDADPADGDEADAEGDDDTDPADEADDEDPADEGDALERARDAARALRARLVDLV